MKEEVMTMTGKERLQQIVQALGISQREFSRKIDMSESYLSSLRNDITLGVVTKISITWPQINLNWLVRGEGDILLATPDEGSFCDYLIKENNSLKAENKELIKYIGKLEAMREHPLIGCKLSAEKDTEYGNVLGQNSDK